MSKQVKVKVLNNGPYLLDGWIPSLALGDTTVGKVYSATQYDEGEIKDIDHQPAGEDGFQFVDDVGDKVFIWASCGVLEVVEG